MIFFETSEYIGILKEVPLILFSNFQKGPAFHNYIIIALHVTNISPNMGAESWDPGILDPIKKS